MDYDRTRRRKTMYERRRDAKSQYIKYDKINQTWIQHRKVVYLYWFKFLQHAERDPRFEVDWGKYRSWGGYNFVMASKFDDWWKEYWLENFGFKQKSEEKSLFHTKKKPEIAAMRTALLVYENQSRGSKWDVGCWVAKQENNKGRVLPKALEGGVIGFYAQRDEGEMDEERETYDIWEIDDLIAGIIEQGQESSGIGTGGREVKNARVRMAKKERDMMGYDGGKSWVTIDRNHALTADRYSDWEESVSQMKDFRLIKKRTQGYVSRYMKQADEYLTNISRGSLDPL
ncbi:hypothetical protein OAW22_00385 [Pseudomonadales bacterium]|nr:hypothetical protein [Pseudomonadales bacterium]